MEALPRPGGLRVTCCADLACFLSPGADKENLAYDISRRASVKDIIESLGIPHTEVGEIRFNGSRADFSMKLDRPGRLKVMAVRPPLDVSKEDLLRPDPFSSIKFIADLNVLKLGRYLLFLGYDTVLARKLDDAEIAELAEAERRIVLTRDTRLLFRKKITFARRVRSVYPFEQLKEVLAFFGLVPDSKNFFTRCVHCNVRLEPVEKGEIYHLLEPKTQAYVHRFQRCPSCLKIFWEGSHYTGLIRRLEGRGIIKIR